MNISPSTTASGLPWVPRCDDARLVLAMAQQHGISELVAGILAGRGVALEAVPQFLHPTLRDQLPDPSHLLDMDKAVARMMAAIEQGQHIAVFGDYDVDGATSTALLMQYFAQIGVAITPYIPDRMSEGYGPSIPAFTQLIEEGSQLIITVDCGTMAHAPIAFAHSRGVDVIVLDHHTSSGALPVAHALVNPNRVDESSPHTNLAAVGVTFLTLVALTKKLREAQFFQSSVAAARGHEAAPAMSREATQKRGEPNLLALLDLVALGTVCDVMPLTGLNRAFVAQGLKVMAARGNLGLATLADVARMDEAPNVYHLGFLLGPRINAGGRVGASGLGVELLTAQEADHAAALAARLDVHNAERQAIEAGVLEQALSMAEAQQNMPVILVAAEGWHPGVIGIVAGRLKEKYQRPAAVVALEGGVGKASARSVPGVDMGAAVHAAVAEGILTTGGGHAMAAGFSLRAESLATLHAFFNARMEAGVAQYNESRVMKFDGVLSVAGATLSTLDDIAQAGPYGLGNPGPRFVLKAAQIVHRTVMKEKHVKLMVTDMSGGGRLAAVAFGAVGTALGDMVIHEKHLHLLGELKSNQWQGRESVQFLISDAARVA